MTLKTNSMGRGSHPRKSLSFSTQGVKQCEQTYCVCMEVFRSIIFDALSLLHILKPDLDVPYVCVCVACDMMCEMCHVSMACIY